jgi:hypothetical protein
MLAISDPFEFSLLFYFDLSSYISSWFYSLGDSFIFLFFSLSEPGLTATLLDYASA